MTYNVPFPFTKYVCCTCEWVLHGNLYKHQVVFITCIDFIKKYIIQYCRTWYGYDHEGFVAMFVNLTHLHVYDNKYDEEEVDEEHSKDGLLTCVGL